MDEENEVKKELLGKWIAQRDNLTILIEALQRELGEEVEPASGTLGMRGGTPIVIVGPPKIKPGEFFGQSQTEAAATYLRRLGHAAQIDQILEALKSGGVKFSGAAPKANLYTVLVRGTRRFVLVSPGTFGLTEFYPNRPRPEKKQRGRRGRPPKSAREGQGSPTARKKQRGQPRNRIASDPKALPAPIEKDARVAQWDRAASC